MKNNKLIKAIYIILISLMFLTQTVFIWTQDNALRGKLFVVAGLLLLILGVFAVFYQEQIRSGFNPKAKPLSKLTKVSFMMFLLFYEMMVVSSFVQGHALKGELLAVAGLILLVAIVFAGYDWILQRRARKKGLIFNSFYKNY